MGSPRLRKRPRSAFLFVLTLLAVASMWFYVERILIPQQVRDATAHNRPRGNLSDLYPRWLGARELLLHRRNPYSHDVTVEIQQGFYGRPLDASRPDDPRDQEAFVYPAHVVFLLAPFVGFPFPAVQIVFGWILVALSAASVPLWLMALRWKLPPMPMAICLALTLGSFPVAQGIKLQQLSLLVGGFLAVSAACAVNGYLFCSGALLALTTIKPQLAGPIVVWLLLWASSEWRARRRLVFGFVSLMALLLAGAQFLLPGWWRMFAEALRQYHQYAQNQSALDLLADGTLGPRVGLALGVVAGLACGIVAWRTRGQKADTPEFAHALGTAMGGQESRASNRTLAVCGRRGCFGVVVDRQPDFKRCLFPSVAHEGTEQLEAAVLFDVGATSASSCPAFLGAGKNAACGTACCQIIRRGK
jgi:hypothetical protein